MNNLQIFNNEDFGNIRAIEIDGKYYFVGRDIAEILEYREPHKAIAAHCKGGISYPILTNGGMQDMKVIPEGDIFRLITKAADQSKNLSIKEKAEKFESWIYDEVLPSIRKHGAYMTSQKIEEALLNPDILIQLATTIKEEKMKNLHLQAENSHLKVSNQIMQPKADYFDELVDRNLLTNFRETAKALKVKESEFIGFLIERKYVFRDKKGKLMPYADKNNGLFDLKECINEKTKWAGVQTLITPKGRETFRLLIGGLDAN